MSAVKMYSYRAVTKAGQLTSGTMPGDGQRQVALALQQKGLTPLSVTLGPVGSPPAGPSATGAPAAVLASDAGGASGQGFLHRLANTSFNLSGRTKISSAALVTFSENLAMLLSAGISLDRSLAIIAELTDSGRLRDVVDDLHARIREGESLGDALAAHAETFPPVFVSMVAAGESGGILEAVLEKLTDYLKSVSETRSFVISAMIYPAFLGFTAVGSIILLLTVVMPRFATIFDDLGAAVPLPAQVMLAAGDFMASYWWLLFGGLAATVLAVRAYVRTASGRRKLDELKLSAPLLGPIFVRIEVGRFTRTLGTLLSNGVPIVPALRIVRGVVQNTVFRAHLDDTLQRVKEGSDLSGCLAEAAYMPSLAVHMIRVGEQTGRLDAMLDRVADALDKDLKAAIKSFTSIFEPAIILVLGAVIAVMVVSILSAIMSINELGI